MNLEGMQTVFVHSVNLKCPPDIYLSHALPLILLTHYSIVQIGRELVRLSILLIQSLYNIPSFIAYKLCVFPISA